MGTALFKSRGVDPDPDLVGSGFNSPAWIRIRIRIQDRIRIQRTSKSGQNVDRMISFHKINGD